MTDLEHAKHAARATRRAERLRWEERLRAFDIIEMRVDEDKPEVAEALYLVAEEIMRSRP